jgi:hypothetical protein
MACRVSKYLFAEGIVSGFPQTIPANNVIGGRILQAFGGLKIGVQRNRVGVFGKISPGVVRYSHVVTSFVFAPHPIELEVSALNTVAWQVGGVVEAYPGRRWLLRIEASDVYSPARIQRSSEAGIPFDSFIGSSHAIVMGFGFGWRF